MCDWLDFPADLCYTFRMENEIQIGQTLIFDGCRWGIVDEVYEDSFVVIDQEGGDHEITASRVDHWD